MSETEVLKNEILAYDTDVMKEALLACGTGPLKKEDLLKDKRFAEKLSEAEELLPALDRPAKRFKSGDELTEDD